MSAMPVLTTTQLSHAYGAADLFHDLSLAVEPRDRIGLVGPNGVGKTTLLLALAGLLEPLGGRVDRAGGLTPGVSAARGGADLRRGAREYRLSGDVDCLADLRRQKRANCKSWRRRWRRPHS